MNIRYWVELSEAERTELQVMLSGGRHAVRRLKRAQILLATDAGQSDEAIATSVAVSASTVRRTKRRFVEGSLERALSEEHRQGARRKLSGQEEALLVATACADPPEGRARWTLELLAGELVRLTEHETLSRETVRDGWPRTRSSPGGRRGGASPTSTASSSRAWRTCSISTPSRPTPSARSCAWTRARCS
jgi:transposase